MQVITIDGVRNEMGKPARIGVIGSCRVHGPVRALTTAGEARALAFPFNTYTHTPLEALQYLHFCLGRRVVPPAMQPLVFGRTEMRYPAQGFMQMVASLDLIIAEISSQSRLTAAGYHLQQNYFSTNFLRSGGKPYLDWWRSVVRQDIGQQQAATDLVASGAADDIWKQEVIFTAETGDMSDEEFAVGLEALVRAHRGRFLLVSHFNFDAEKTVPVRDRNIALLRQFAKRHGVGFFDPSPVVIAKGREAALKAGGKDTYHYEPSFEAEVGLAMSDLVTEVLRGAPDNIGREPASPGGATVDRTLLDLDAPETLRSAVVTVAETNDAEMADALRRRLLELQPDDSNVLLAVGERAAAKEQWRSALVFADRILAIDELHAAARNLKTRALDALGEGDPVETLQQLLEAGDMDELSAFCRCVLRQYPEAAGVRQCLIQAIEEARFALERAVSDGEQVAQAAALDRLRALDPANEDQWIEKRRALVQHLMITMRESVDAGSNEAAVQSADALIEIDAAVADSHLVRGRIMLASGDAEGAGRSFSAAVAEQPDRAWPHLNLARALSKAGDPAGAAAAFVRVIDLAKGQPEAAQAEEARQSLRGMASTLIRHAREISAAATGPSDDLREFNVYRLAAKALGEDGDLASLSSALRRRSLLRLIELEKSEDPALAVAVEVHLQMDPDCVRTRNIAGRHFMRLRTYELSLEHWERLVALEPDVAHHHLQVARCMDWLGMTDGMLAAASQCLELEPDNSEARALAAKSTAMVAELE